MNRPTNSTTNPKDRKMAPTASKPKAIIIGWDYQQGRYWANQLDRLGTHRNIRVGSVERPVRIAGEKPDSTDLYIVGRSHEMPTMTVVRRSLDIASWVAHVAAHGYGFEVIKGETDIIAQDSFRAITQGASRFLG